MSRIAGRQTEGNSDVLFLSWVAISCITGSLSSQYMRFEMFVDNLPHFTVGVTLLGKAELQIIKIINSSLIFSIKNDYGIIFDFSGE